MPTIAKNTLLLTGSFLFCLLLSEAVTRIVAPQWLNYRMHILQQSSDIEFGSDANFSTEMKNGAFFRYTPGSQFTISHYEYHNTVHIDEYGLRTTPANHGKKNNELRLILGDSFTLGVGVEDKETFVNILAKKKPHTLLNLGVPGTALHNQLDTLELRYHELGSPKDIVFAFFLGNDFADLINGASQQDTTSTVAVHAEQNQGLLQSINRLVSHLPLINQSFLIQFVRAKLVLLLNKKQLKYANPVFKLMQNNSEYIQAAQSALNTQLDRLVGLQQELLFSPTFYIIPDHYQIDAKMRENQANLYGINPNRLDPSMPNTLLTAALKQRGIRYIDPTNCLKQFSAKTLYYTQDDHFTALGQQRFAECIMDQGS